ncbi:MAG: RNA polymerase sigma factor [Chitinophagales bacterium]
MTEKELIQACKQNNRKAQRLLYERLAPKMFGVCKRYVRNEADVEDVLLKGFYKVFSNLCQYSYQGSFEGWVRRIMVNESLSFLRQNKKRMGFSLVSVEEQYHLETSTNADDKLLEGDVLQLLDELPQGYRTVFNLYAIEGYGHREIAEMLGVSINTSKSQLLKARRMLQKLLIACRQEL